MNPSVYAHSLPGQPLDKWQPLEEHLKAVAEMAREIHKVTCPLTIGIKLHLNHGKLIVMS